MSQRARSAKPRDLCRGPVFAGTRHQRLWVAEREQRHCDERMAYREQWRRFKEERRIDEERRQKEEKGES